MASRVHSVRFMIGRGGDRTETFTVPPGRRAVIRSCSYQPWGGTQQQLLLEIHGIAILTFFTAPGYSWADAHKTREGRWTAYAGETIRITINGSDTAYSLDGYLFFDDALEPDDADNVIAPL